MSSRLPRWQVVALLLLTAWLYASILTRLFLQWVGPSSDPNFQHGIFVPLFALFVLWQDRKKLGTVASSPSWVGLALVVSSLLTLVLGVLGAENFLSRVSLLILLAGLIILFRGWTFFRAVLFPWAFLILMIPIPNLIIQQVTFPLQLLASKLATGMLELVGVPVLRQGNMIVLAAMPLDVAEACSGIRSLLTLVTLAIIYGYLMETRIWVRVLLACCALPIAVVANSFRVFGTGMLVQYWDPDKAEGFFHTFEGWLIFVVALVMLFAVHRLISLIWKSGSPAAPRATASEENQSENTLHIKAGAPRFGIAAVLMLATAVGLQAHSRSEYFPPRASLSSLPSQIDGWTGLDQTIDQQTLDILGPGEYLVRDYENTSQPQPPINLYIAYFPTQKAGDTIHSPNHCLPGAGWVPTSRTIIQLTRPDGSSFPVNQYVVSKAGDRQLVLYWFQAHGRAVASEYWAKYYLVADAIRLNRSDGGLIRLMSPMYRGETPEAAQARILQLGSQFFPLLDSYIPR
ncbi:MAG: VPLPA-CTERM-specific exosortase XrtD [Acidobacteriia bacterium]|nr:VPLPA-CTERM-specific exosortase XrtD [Terriglobia bacterium]